MHLGQFSSTMDSADSRLESSLFFDCHFSSVIAAFATYSVIYVPCATVRAEYQSRSYSFVVSSSLSCSCLRLFSFWMCHFLIYYLLLSINFLNASHRGSLFSFTSSVSACLLCFCSSATIASLHSPSACTCFIGIVNAIVS